MRCSILICGVLTLFAGRTLAEDPVNELDLVKPTSITKLVEDGKHNAFTALVKWKDQYWLAFRAAPSHAYGEADIVVMRSSDGKEWKEQQRLNIQTDDRDPQFLATASRLFLYVPSMEGTKCTSFATYTDDGEKWSKPEPVYEPTFIMWKPIEHEGKFYAGVHKKAEGGDAAKVREAHLVMSDDGLNWKKLSTIRAGNWESETTIHFEKDGTLTAFLRQKYGSPKSAILTSSPPYSEWKETPGPVHFSGHAMRTLGGKNYLFSRRIYGKDTGTIIYTWDQGTLTPYCMLPSGGDCSYPEAVEIGDEMLVSYYSSHENGTNIYLARVPLKK